MGYEKRLNGHGAGKAMRVSIKARVALMKGSVTRGQNREIMREYETWQVWDQRVPQNVRIVCTYCQG